MALNGLWFWLGEHRKSISRLYQKSGEARSMNYGDYTYMNGTRTAVQYVPRAPRIELLLDLVGPVQTVRVS